MFLIIFQYLLPSFHNDWCKEFSVRLIQIPSHSYGQKISTLFAKHSSKSKK